MSYFNNFKKSFSGFKKNFRKTSDKRVKVLNEKRKVVYEKGMTRVRKRPLLSFFALLLILFGLIILSNSINRPPEEIVQSDLAVKEVSTYSIGESPKITVQAKIEKSGVIKIVSLGSGVVGSINVKPGDAVGKGANLIQLVSNYEGGNAPAVQAQLAYTQYKNVVDTFDAQKEIIGKQRELTEKSGENAQELRNITGESVDSTRNLIDLNNSILSTLESQQQELEETNVNGANDAAILQTKQLRSQFQSANLQLGTSLDNAEYSTDDENPPAEIANLNKEITLKQLELQEKALELNKEVSRLNLTLAQIQAAIMHPVAPISGVVERVYVREGQAVNPGTPLVQITGDSESLIAVALLGRETAQAVSRSLVSSLFFGNETYQAVPFYVSEDATDGSLYSAQFSIPEEFAGQVTDRQYIIVEIPLSIPDTGSTIPFVPIDAVFQTQDESYLFLVEKGKAVSRPVSLGNVIGRYVEVTKGLNEGDQVILNRNVIAGDPVEVIN